MRSDYEAPGKTETRPFGETLRTYRKALSLSQMKLSLSVGVSEKHLSFLETGRTQPSRDMVRRLAEGLNLGPEDAAILFASAGYTAPGSARPAHAEMVGSVRIVRMLLDRHDPYPAVALDESWNVIQSNAAAKGFRRAMANSSREMNMAKLFLAPDGYRGRIRDWDHVAAELMNQLRSDLGQCPSNRALHKLVERCENYPGVRCACRLGGALPDQEFRSVTYRTTVGDVRMYTSLLQVCFPTGSLLKSTRIEFSFPADSESAALCEGAIARLAQS